jgi:hypothetical protein
MSIEQDLHRALRRQPAPPDFADRVMARIDESRQEGTPLGHSGRPDAARRPAGYMRWLAAAAAVILVASGAARYQAYQQEAAEAERVKRDIRVALQITNEMFSLAQHRIEAATQNSR